MKRIQFRIPVADDHPFRSGIDAARKFCPRIGPHKPTYTVANTVANSEVEYPTYSHSIVPGGLCVRS